MRQLAHRLPNKRCPVATAAAQGQQVASTTVTDASATDVLTTAQLTASAPVVSMASSQPAQTTVMTKPRLHRRRQRV